MVELHIKVSGPKKANGRIVSLASEFDSQILAEIDGRRLNTKSIMNTSVIERTLTIHFLISGTDEEQAAAAIKNYFAFAAAELPGMGGSGAIMNE